MKTVLFNSIKGGVGKTSLAAHLTVYLLMKGYRVAIMDCDPQGNFTRWVDRYQAVNENDCLFEFSGNVAEIDTFKKTAQYDFLIIDSRGADGEVSRYLMAYADYLLSPVEPNQFSLDTIPDHDLLVQTIKNEFNPDLHSFYFLNLCSTNVKDKKRQDTLDVLKAMVENNELHSVVLDSVIFNRSVIENSVGIGSSCFVGRKNKSREELSKLFEVLE